MEAARALAATIDVSRADQGKAIDDLLTPRSERISFASAACVRFVRQGLFTQALKVRTNSLALLSQTPHFHNCEESASCECGGGKNNHKTFLPAKHRYQTKDERRGRGSNCH